MRTAFVTSSVSRDAGGLFFAMTQLARGLHESGCGITAHGIHDAHSARDESAWSPVACHAHRRVGPPALGYSPELRKALMDADFDLVHTHGIWQWPSAAVHQWHRHSGKPYLVSPHGMLDPWALALSSWKKRIASLWYESAHLRDAACIHALCQSEADSIRAYGLKNPVAIIPNGVDLPEIGDQGSGDRGQGTGDRGQGSGVRGQEERYCYSSGGFIRRRDSSMRCGRGRLFIQHPTFKIQNLTNGNSSSPGWDQGGHEAELKRLCDELGLAYADVPAASFLTENCKLNTENSQILFLGPAFGEAKDQLLRRASAFILPSFSEGLPMSVLEAWSYRLPVLMTDECNLPEGFAANAAIRIGTGIRGQGSGNRGQGTGVRDQGTGDREQPLGIDEGMWALFEMSDADRDTMGRQGRALVESHFTWPMVAAQMKEVYEWVLGGGAVPGCVRE